MLEAERKQNKELKAESEKLKIELQEIQRNIDECKRKQDILSNNVIMRALNDYQSELNNEDPTKIEQKIDNNQRLLSDANKHLESLNELFKCKPNDQ